MNKRDTAEREIMLNIPFSEFAVWCRNGEVCSKATLCRGLTCKYKKDMGDVVDGIKKCGMARLYLGYDFDYAQPLNNWEWADE